MRLTAKSAWRPSLTGVREEQRSFVPASPEVVERELRKKLAALETQIMQFQKLIENIPQGVSLFGADERLILSNARFAELYRLAPEQVRPGLSLSEIVALRIAAGTCPVDSEAYLALSRSIQLSELPRVWSIDLADGRTLHVSHRATLDGGWVATHEDITEQKAPRALADQRISLQALIDWVPDNLWIKDVRSTFVVANRATATQIGLRGQEDLVGKSDCEIHPPELARQFLADERRILQSGEPIVGMEEHVFDAAGRKTWMSTTKVPLRNDRGEIFGLVGISRDITERRLADSLRDGQAQILEMIAMSAPLEDVLAKLMLLIESQMTGMFGSVLLLEEDGLHLRHGAAPSLAPAYAKAIDGVAIGPHVGSCGTAVHRRETVVVRDIQTDPLWVDFKELAGSHGYRSCWSTPILSHQGAVLGTFAMYSSTVREPTAAEARLIEAGTRIAGIAIERRLAEDRIHFMANHDALTGLPNRMLLKDRLSQALLYAQKYDRWVTAVFIDLDNFKFVNDSLGHSAGDVLLTTVARRMVESVGASDTVVRLGGDEFVVLLLDQPKDVEEISAAVRRLMAAIAQPVDLDGHDIAATCSVGIASYPGDGKDADSLIANADAAMYRAKEMGRDNFQFYAPVMNTKVRERLTLQEELRGAVARSEFILHYQPQVDLRTGRVFAVEALIRWNHPTLGLVSPVKFISMAEETGLIVPIGDWVLHEACRQNKAWQIAGLPPMTVCVNVSARQFRERNLISRVKSALTESGLEAKYLELEMTESLVMQDVEIAVATMTELQALGIQLSIDDFGTGYSSLSALTTFPLARLKIDRSFIRDLDSSANDRAVASAVISLGQKLNLRVIAEGVETDEQMDFLRDSNCDEIQGYHFSKPIPADEIATLLSDIAKGGDL